MKNTKVPLGKSLIGPRYIVAITAILALLMVVTGAVVIKRTSHNMLRTIEREGVVLTEGLVLSSENILKAGAVIEPLFTQKLMDIAGFALKEAERTGTSKTKLDSIAAEYGLSRIDIFDKKGNLMLSTSDILPDEKTISLLEPIFSGDLKEVPLGFVENDFGIALREGNKVIACYINAEYIKAFQRETGIGGLIKKMSKERGIEYIALQDKDGIVFASDNVHSMEKIDADTFLARHFDSTTAIIGSPASRFYQFQNQKVLEVVKPFIIEGESFGLFRVGFSLTQYNEIVGENRNHIIVLILVVFLLGAILVNLLVVTQSYKILDKSYGEIRSLTGSILESMGNAVVAIDSSHKITTLNKSAESLFSISRTGAIGKSYETIFSKDECLLSMTLEQSRTIAEITRTYIKLGGEERILSISTSTIFSQASSPEAGSPGNRKTEGAVAVIRDITELKQMEEEIKEKERLSALGDLSAGVAHEIRNPLNAISLTAQRIEQDFEPKENFEEFKKFINIIKNEIAGLNKIVEQFLYLARPMSLNLKKEDINKVLEDVTSLMGEEAREKGITINKQFALKDFASIPSVEIDSEKMRRAFLNIIRNGIEATGKEGKLYLSTELRDNACEITIRDTGRGISKEDLPKIFRPYFTKKDKGTGLGLAITHQIITAHKGNIEVESVEGIGTTFIISLPC